MPDRFWVGGTASWDGTAGTKWSATSGGAGGASVPTSADDVFFNAASGAGTVTIAGGNLGARSINCTGFTGTITGFNPITVSGSVTLAAAMTWTHDNTVTFNGTGTLTTAGKLFSSIVITGATTVLTLGDNFNQATSRSITVTQGTFNTANFNVNAGTLISSNSNTRTINLGSSTLTLAGISFTTTTGLTFNGGTSLINIAQSGATFISTTTGPIPVFNNVSFTILGSTATTIGGSSVFNNLSFTAPASAGVGIVNFDAGTVQTINGTLSTTGTAGNRRVWFRSTTYGISTSLVVNSAPGLTDADFRDVIVTGTVAPISGTRIGDLRGNSGIVFSTPKTVFRYDGGSWAANQWTTVSGSLGGVSTDNFPLAQDTAIINQATRTVLGAVVMDSAIPYCGTVDMSARTSAFTLSVQDFQTVYGDWINGSGITISSVSNFTFSGRNTQTITSAGKAFNSTVIVDTYGGTVILGDAYTSSGSLFNVTNGTFDTAGFSMGVGRIVSTSSNVRSIFLRSSTVTSGGASGAILDFGTTATNLTFDAGTSTITGSGTLFSSFSGGGMSFNNVSFTSTSQSVGIFTINGNNIFNNLTIVSAAAPFLRNIVFSANQTITDTLTVAGSSATSRNFVRSSVLGTIQTLTVGTLAATDCDFRDIAIAGAATGSSPTRAGDCGGNSGITFPAPKTVFWNLAGTQNWSATAWATISGGTPAVDNFPLAQDTAVCDNTGAAGTVTADREWNIGSLNASSRTTAMTFAIGAGLFLPIYGSWTSGAGMTISTSGNLSFTGRSTSTITSNGIQYGFNIEINAPGGTVQLADALTATETRSLTLVRGTFDAVSYNVTVGAFSGSGSNIRSLRMGTGTWTLSSTGTVWNLLLITNLNFDKGTANILLSDTSTTARTFDGGGLAYNKLTIGGATSTSTTTIFGNNSFTELASTKTVAHTIALGSTTQIFGAWTVTGAVGNVVTLTGTGTGHLLSGAATSGIDYLSMGSIGFSSASSGEFYAGPNSTGTAGIPVFRTQTPAPRTLYWVGGTGNWNDTARWSLSSGGAGGEAIPTSLDNVIFNSASNATAYTVTLNVPARCNQLTIAGPASGNMTLASSSTANRLVVHGNTVFPSTGFTRSFTSPIVLSGSTTSKTFTSNGVVFQGLGGGSMQVDGIGAGWSMTDALNLGNNDALFLLNGTLSTNNFNLTVATINASSGGSKTLNLGSSTVTMNGSSSPINFGSTATQRNLFTFNTGTSTVNITAANPSFGGNEQTFYDVAITQPATLGTTSIGAGTFRNLTFGAASDTGVQNIDVSGNITVTGTLTFSAGINSTRRNFFRSNTPGTIRTITASAFSGTDVDFRDITITGAAAPVSGTRFGDCGGNSGITFPTGVLKYWNLAGGGNWSATAWALTSNGTPAADNFPLAQDACVFGATGLNSGATVTIDRPFNIGTIDMSARTTNTMTLAHGTVVLSIHGNWINGTGTTISGSGNVNFRSRSSQTITSAGITFPQQLIIFAIGGTVTLLDALTMSSSTLNLTAGTLNLNNFNIITGGLDASTTTYARTLAASTNTTITASGTFPFTFSTTLFSITGSGTFSATSASTKTFAGGGVNFSGFTLNQGGAGQLTITGNNTFRDITATQTASSAATISLGTTTQRLAQFTGKGEASRLFTIQGSAASFPATIIYTGSGPATGLDVNHLTLVGVRAYPLANTWYAGPNSTNSGTLGWAFTATPVPVLGTGGFLMLLL